MAIGQNIRFFVDGIDLACALKSFDGNSEAEMLDSTTLCTTGSRTFVQGLKNGTLSASGIWDADTTAEDKIDDVMKAAFSSGTTETVTASLGAIAQGGVALMAHNAKVQSYGVPVELGQLIMANVELQSDNEIENGKWLYDDNVDTGSQTGASVDNGASSTNGGYFQAHLYAADTSTATSGTFTLQHSSDNSIWVDLIASTPIAAAHGAISATVAAGTSVNRYLRVIFTAAGGIGFGVAAFVRR